jgi:hypothetical protein
LEGSQVEEFNDIYVAYKESIHILHRQSNRSAEIFFLNINSEIMVLSSRKDIESFITHLVSNAIFTFSIEHHNILLIDVIHNIFDLGFESRRIDEIEVDLLVCSNHKVICTLCVEQEPSFTNLVVFHPVLLSRVLVILQLKEENHIRTSDNHGSIFDEVNIP